MEYTLIRSKRKTTVLQVKSNGEVIVRAPLHRSRREIDDFVRSREDWIADAREKLADAQKDKRIITPQEREWGKKSRCYVHSGACGLFRRTYGYLLWADHHP